MWMNELAHAVWIIHLQWLLYGRQNGTRWYYAMLPGSTESCSEHTQTHTFKNHANLLTYWQTDRCTPWIMAFKALLNTKVALS